MTALIQNEMVILETSVSVSLEKGLENPLDIADWSKLSTCHHVNFFKLFKARETALADGISLSCEAICDTLHMFRLDDHVLNEDVEDLTISRILALDFLLMRLGMETMSLLANKVRSKAVAGSQVESSVNLEMSMLVTHMGIFPLQLLPVHCWSKPEGLLVVRRRLLSSRCKYIPSDFTKFRE